MESVGSRELCQPRTEADGKPVTESNLSLRAPAQRAAVRSGGKIELRDADSRQYQDDLSGKAPGSSDGR